MKKFKLDLPVINSAERRSEGMGIKNMCVFYFPCVDLCGKIWPELREGMQVRCPCRKWGCKKALKKLDAYLSAYEAKHKGE